MVGVGVGGGEGSGRGQLCRSIKLHYVCMYMDNSKINKLTNTQVYRHTGTIEN